MSIESNANMTDEQVIDACYASKEMVKTCAGVIKQAYPSGNMTSHTDMTEEKETDGTLSADMFSLPLFLGLLISVLMLMFLLERRWRKWQRRLAKATDNMTQAHEFAADTVRMLAPDFEPPTFQFTGLQQQCKSVDIAFDDLSLELPGGSRVLKGVSGEFQGGRLSAIMGPSGAGKTTFMNVLCGRATYGRMCGEVRLNGKAANIGDLKGVVGFVPQDDIVYEDLTVREQLEFSAKLRNDTSVSASRIRRIVDDVLNILWLSNVQTSLVGGVENRGISGGQRKRVNIGTELVAQPSVLFLDEPTSGLDSTGSLFVAASLKRIGCARDDERHGDPPTKKKKKKKKRKVIHQPRYSLFTLIDDVLLLGKGGSVVYLGSTADVKSYFEGLGFAMQVLDNPADWFMDIISGTVTNTQVPNFTQKMLFHSWATRQTEGKDARLAPVRTLSTDIRHTVLREALADEWDRVDITKGGVMWQFELRALLASCSGVIPDIEIVHDLMCRMAGKGVDSVTKEQFLAFMCSLGEEIAYDHAPSLSSVPFGDESSSGSESASLARRLPKFGEQVKAMMLRRIVQWWRMQNHRLIFVAAVMLAGAFFGIMDRWLHPLPRWHVQPLQNLHAALAMLLAIFSLHVFGNNQPVLWRQRARGINMLAVFVARVVVNTLDLLILTLAFTQVYWIVRQVNMSYWSWMAPFLFTAVGASGWGYFISTAVAPTHGAFMATLVVFITCPILGNLTYLKFLLDGGFMEVVVSLVSLTRWSVAMSFVHSISETEPEPQPLWSVFWEAKREYMKRDVGIGLWGTAAVGILLQALLLFAASYVCLTFRNRQRIV